MADQAFLQENRIDDRQKQFKGKTKRQVVVLVNQVLKSVATHMGVHMIMLNGQTQQLDEFSRGLAHFVQRYAKASQYEWVSACLRLISRVQNLQYDDADQKSKKIRFMTLVLQMLTAPNESLSA
jgi:hypothetical protein